MSAIDSNKDLSEDEVLQQKAEVQKELDDALEKALLEVQETDAQVTTKLKKHWDGVEKVVEEFKSALSDAKDILSSFLSLLSSANDKSNNDLKIWGDVMNKVIDKRIEALNKQKEALEENNEATERAIELSKAQDALARAQQQRTTRVYTENGYEWQANAEDVRTAREDLADKQREWNNKDAEKAIDDQIKKYNEFKDKLSEVMDDIGKGWKDYQKELEYTAQIQKMSLSQMEGSLDSYHNKIIASLNTGSAITGVQNLIANLESLINTLTKLNNLYSMLKTGEYKDLGIKGLWDTIKGFFGKGKSENVNKSFKDTFDAAKKAFNAGKKQLTDTATTGANDVINAMINQIKTSGNGLVETFGGIWEKIKLGAQSLFSGSGEGGGIVSTVVNGFKAIGNAVSKSKIGSTILGGLGNVGTALVSGGGKLVAGAGKLITTAGSALAAAGPAAIPIAGAAALGIYGGTKAMKNQKKIWSNKEDGFGKKAVKSVASFFWDISPIGAIVNLCKDISGKSKKTAENTKDTADNTSETADNTKKQQSVTNLTINATQVVSKEENKVTDATDKKNDVTSNESQTTDNIAGGASFGRVKFSTLWSYIKSKSDSTYQAKGSYAAASHTHNYAGSGSAGGSANSAAKLDTATAGSTTQPVYFSGGKPVAIGYTIAKSVPADAKFTDTNTWRGIQNNLISDSTDQSLSAAQGKALKTLVDGKAPTSHTHTKSQITDFPTSMPASDVYAWAKAATKPSYTKAEVGLSNVDNTAAKDKSVKYAETAGTAEKAVAADNGIAAFNVNNTSTMPTGYIRFNNGIQICWGKTYSGNTSGSFTYPQSFSGLPSVMISGTGAYRYAFYVTKFTKTGFEYYRDGSGDTAKPQYIAIGSWEQS